MWSRNIESLDPHGALAKDRKPMTNADRIRAMSDEELEGLFREVYSAGCDDATAWGFGTRQDTFKWDDDWLQQPAEEDK